MKWTLKKIQEHRGEPLYFDQTVNRESSLMKRDREILAVSDIHAAGFLLYENHAVLANFQIDYTITLPSSRSLTPVDVRISVPINETYVEMEIGSAQADDLSEVVMPIEDGEVDLIEAIEDTILLNIPSQILTEEEMESNEMPTGNDWVLVSEEEYQQKRTQEKEGKIDPRLAKLKALLEDEEDKE